MAFIDPAKLAADTLARLGIKGTTDVDFTFMDGEDFPNVGSDEHEIGVLTPEEALITKAMISAANSREEAKRRISGELMMRLGKLMASGGATRIDPTKVNVAEGAFGLLAAFEIKDEDELGMPPRALMGLMDREHITYEMLNQMLYHSIKSRLDRWGDKSVGLRRHGRIVSDEKEWSHE